MPRKIRELIRDLQKAGFVKQWGKGSHRNFKHVNVKNPITLSGKEGDDAQHYQEKDVRRVIKEAKRCMKAQNM
ncbi:MAG: type II toxin-antitoxin system HicA family toxin [Bacteroidetes bacterium]|nr:type II toxin-antitoxin system HicA family toxin [Bacteroidota bacterium]